MLLYLYFPTSDNFLNEGNHIYFAIISWNLLLYLRPVTSRYYYFTRHLMTSSLPQSPIHP